MSGLGYGDAKGAARGENRGVKYALISDVHPNLPALESVLADIASRPDVSAIYLGDLVGYAPWPNETLGLIQSRCIAGVAGNYDSTVGTDCRHAAAATRIHARKSSPT